MGFALLMLTCVLTEKMASGLKCKIILGSDKKSKGEKEIAFV